MTFRIDISWPSDAHENLESVADIKMSVRDRVFTRLFDEAGCEITFVRPPSD
jgi:hypothetical protein